MSASGILLLVLVPQTSLDMPEIYRNEVVADSGFYLVVVAGGGAPTEVNTGAPVGVNTQPYMLVPAVTVERCQHDAECT